MQIELNTIITATVTALITWFARQIYTSMIKPAWIKATIDQRRKAALRRLVKYVAIIIAISLITAFMSLNKLFVLLVCFCFSIMIILFIYDYTLNMLRSIIAQNKKEENERRKNILLFELGHATDEKHKQKLIEELRSL